MKNTFDGLTSRLDTAKKRIGALKDIAIKTSQTVGAWVA